MFPIVLFLFSLYPALVLLVAGVSKLAYQASFKGSLEAQRIVPALSIPLLTWIIPIAEVLISFGIVWLANSFLFLASLAFLGFSVFRVVLKIKHKDIGCGCYGPYFGNTENDLGGLVATLIQMTMALVVGILLIDYAAIPFTLRALAFAMQCTFLFAVFVKHRLVVSRVESNKMPRSSASST